MEPEDEGLGQFESTHPRRLEGRPPRITLTTAGLQLSTHRAVLHACTPPPVHRTGVPLVHCHRPLNADERGGGSYSGSYRRGLRLLVAYAEGAALNHQY